MKYKVEIQSAGQAATLTQDGLTRAHGNPENIVSIAMQLNANEAMASALRGITDGKMMVGEFTRLDTIVKYQEIARAALALIGAE